MALTNITCELLEKYFRPQGNDHAAYYMKSYENYKKYKNNGSKSKNKEERQWEKDERVWTAITLISLFEDRDTLKDNLKNILIKAYGPVPPIKNIKNQKGDLVTWDDCLKEDINQDKKLELFLEANLPAPKLFKEHLSHNLYKTNFIPYIQDWGKETNPNGTTPYRRDLEGATNVDALIINTYNGFSIFIEAKVLADISTQVTYDMKRNQIARNLDVMLQNFQDGSKESKLKNLCDEYRQIDSDASLFLLLTPQVFKNDWQSRLYGYKYWDYKSNPMNIKKDLSHRMTSSIDWSNLSDRIGWTTWEDICKKDIEEIIKSNQDFIIEDVKEDKEEAVVEQ